MQRKITKNSRNTDIGIRKMTEKKPIKIGNHTIAKRHIGFVFAAIVVIAAVYIYMQSLSFQSTDDAYIEAHLTQIAPKVSGQVVDVYINDNQKVKENDVVIKIDDTDYKVKLAQAEANFQKALFGQKVARANLAAVNSEIALAKKDLERYKNLYSEGAVSKQTLDEAQTKFPPMQLTGATIMNAGIKINRDWGDFQSKLIYLEKTR